MSIICTTAFETDWIVEFDYTITFPGTPAKLSGPPEDCYPAEAREYTLEFIALRPDLPGSPGPAVDVPEWLKAIIIEWLVNSQEVAEIIDEEEDS